MAIASHKPKLPLLILFSKYLHQRGLSPLTIERYQYAVAIIIPTLGANPEKLTPALIQQVVCDLASARSLEFGKSITVALRSYLRFLSFEGLCPPDLDKTVPTVAQCA